MLIFSLLSSLGVTVVSINSESPLPATQRGAPFVLGSAVHPTPSRSEAATQPDAQS
jgi:hypothetical protein